MAYVPFSSVSCSRVFNVFSSADRVSESRIGFLFIMTIDTVCVGKQTTSATPTISLGEESRAESVRTKKNTEREQFPFARLPISKFHEEMP
jgi:hypothetical protein